LNLGEFCLLLEIEDEEWNQVGYYDIGVGVFGNFANGFDILLGEDDG
jgi:hypothetical protein